MPAAPARAAGTAPATGPAAPCLAGRIRLALAHRLAARRAKPAPSPTLAADPLAAGPLAAVTFGAVAPPRSRCGRQGPWGHEPVAPRAPGALRSPAHRASALRPKKPAAGRRQDADHRASGIGPPPAGRSGLRMSQRPSRVQIQPRRQGRHKAFAGRRKSISAAAASGPAWCSPGGHFPHQDARPGALPPARKGRFAGRFVPSRAQRPAADSSVFSDVLALAALPAVASTNFQASRSSVRLAMMRRKFSLACGRP